jgi:hypothetical protein
MDCAHCGSALREGGHFCAICGTRAGPAEEPPPADQPSFAAPPTPVTHHQPPGAGQLLRALRVVAALVTLALSAVTLTAILAPAALPVWMVNWLLILPLAPSTHVAEAEMIPLITVSGTAVLVSGTAVLHTLALLETRAVLMVLALAYIGVLVGNAAAFPGGISDSSYVLGQSGATATWVCLALVLAAGIGAVFTTGQHTVIVVGGLIAGVVFTGIGAGAAVAQARHFAPYEGAYSPVTSTGTGTGSGQAAPATSNQPGACAVGWTSLLDVTTSSMRATVCQTASQTFLAARLSDGSTIELPALAQGSGWSADDGTTSYSVDPGFIAIYQNGYLSSDQATTSASGPRSTPDALTQLAAMVKLAHQGRAEVARLDQLTLGCGSPSNGASLIGQVAANRAQLLAAAEKLAQDSSASGLPIAQFVSSMQWSLDADHAWQHWIVHAWEPWAAAGCTGQVTRNGRADFGRFVADSEQADRTKTAFVNAYDPIAAQHGLQSNWIGLDI